MQIRKVPAAYVLSYLGICLLVSPASARKKTKPAPIVQMTNAEKTLHALNRLAFGPRPGDLQSVTSIGLKKWIEAQLNPQSIPGKSPIWRRSWRRSRRCV